MAQPKRLALLCYLTLTSLDQYRQRDTIVALFWPEFEASRARGALRQALSWLRHELRGEVLTTRGEEEIGVAASGLWCDVLAFDVAMGARDFERALELYRGPLLEGVFVAGADAEFERWLDAERSRRHQQATRAAIALADREGTAGRMAAAVDWASRAAFLSPNDEDVHRRRLQLLAAAGDRAGALAAHAAFAERFVSEFGTSPSAETARVVGEVQSSRGVAQPEAAATIPRRNRRDEIRGGVDDAVETSPAKGSADRYASPEKYAAALRVDAQAFPPRVGVFLRGRLWRWPALLAIAVVVATTAAALSRRSPIPPAPPTRQQVTRSGTAGEPALGPDGRTIAFVEESCPAAGDTCGHELVTRDLAGEQTVLLARGTLITNPKWNPDGSHILFQARGLQGAADTAQRGSYLVPRMGGNLQRIGPNGAASFSATGDTIVVANSVNGEITLRFLRSADAEVFDSASVPFLGSSSDLDWSPDGKWLAILVYRGEGIRKLLLVSRRGGTVTDSIAVAGRRYVRWVPAGDAVQLLLQGGSSDDIVFRLGVDRRKGKFNSKRDTVLTIPAGGGTFDVSRDGTTLAFVERARTTTELIAMERDGERVTMRSLLSFTGWSSSNSPALSPNGRSVAFSRGDPQGGNLYLIPFEGGTQRPVTSARDHTSTPIWLRDERLVFKKGLPSAQLYVVHPADARPRPFGPAGYTTGNPFYLQWLDDSLYVLDQRDQHRVLVVDGSGSLRDTITVPDSLDQLLTVTPDARQLLFFDFDYRKGRFYSVDRATKQVKVAFDTPPNYEGLGWANGAYVFATWPRPARSSPTVWRVNPGGTSTRIAALPTDCDFTSLSMSRDGRRFVCKREDAKRDIWLLTGVNLGR